MNAIKMNEKEVPIRFGSTQPLTVGNTVFKSAFDWSLSEKDLEKAARELGETDEEKEVCLRKLKDKLSKNSDVNYRQDDFYLLRFLRVRKFDVKKAYQIMKTFFEIRRKHRDIMTVPPLLDLKPLQQLNVVTVLPYADEEGRILFLLNLSKWNPLENTFEEIAATAINVLDIATLNPNCQINGVIGVYDFGEITLRHVTELLRSGWLWTIITAIQNGYPWRLKKWYIVNTNRLVRFFYGLIKTVLSRKLQDRCVLLGSDMSELHKHVNPVLLPERLKGNLEEDACDTSQHVLENLDYLRYERSFM